MRELVIATGTSRMETKWRNNRIQWSQLVKKLANTTRTPETFKEYMSLSKTKRDKIKDVGGFVGGECIEGKRSARTIRFRDVLTLDIDNIPTGVDVWFIFTCIYDCAALVYSTHKHSPTAPRLRLILPLSRPVTSEEYEAVGRWIAHEVGIDYFDDTTYQASRLMYWPSTSVDAEYFYQVQDGDELDVDKILSKYADWHDVASWPYSSRISSDAIKKTADKQEDPLVKEGVIGAFCRIYTISEAIEQFLPEIYIATDDNSRYSYAGGSTASGLVIYDDKFAYSHHSTDPAGGRLLNAFDLVRIHKFGDMDLDTKEGTKPGSLPSFKAMTEYVLTLSDIKVELASVHVAKADDFEIIQSDENWLEKLDMGGRSGKEILATYNNIELILENDANLKGLISFNEMSGRITFVKKAPWRDSCKYGDIWSDADDTALESYVERTYGITASKKIRDSVVAVQNKHRYHPIRDYFASLPPWDGVARAETLFIDYLAAEDTHYTRAVTKKVLAAAVKRIYFPGCKWDYITTFTGPQGAGKSTLIEKLGKDWYSDTIITVAGKEGMEQLEGVWLGEIAELTATKRADVEAVKQFISRTVDDYRPAYARHKTPRPRQCIFFGTTNSHEFLRDMTGNRRYLVIPIKGYKEATKNIWEELDVDQVWAEVLTFYKDEILYVGPDIEDDARKMQEEHLEESPKAGMIREFLDRKLPSGWNDMSLEERRNFIHNDFFDGPVEGTEVRDRVCVAEVWCELFRGDLKQLDRMTSREIGDVIRSTDGWESISTSRFGDLYGVQRGFMRNKTTLDDIAAEMQK